MAIRLRQVATAATAVGTGTNVSSRAGRSECSTSGGDMGSGFLPVGKAYDMPWPCVATNLQQESGWHHFHNQRPLDSPLRPTRPNPARRIVGNPFTSRPLCWKPGTAPGGWLASLSPSRHPRLTAALKGKHGAGLGLDHGLLLLAVGGVAQAGQQREEPGGVKASRLQCRKACDDVLWIRWQRCNAWAVRYAAVVVDYAQRCMAHLGQGLCCGVLLSAGAGSSTHLSG